MSSVNECGQEKNPSRTVSGTTFTRTGGQHGSDATLAARPGLGEVMGVVIERPGERTVYIAGDTVLTGAVEARPMTVDPQSPRVPVASPFPSRCSVAAAGVDVIVASNLFGDILSDLTAAMGINSPSLYAAFGCKEALFREAVALYNATEGAVTDRALEAAPRSR